MAENLPLIPEKQSALCSDIQQVLRDVFREHDYLPPLVSEPFKRDKEKEYIESFHTPQWIENLTSEEKQLYDHEEELKQEFAKRLAREPLPNIYKLYSPVERDENAGWREEQGIIERKHLRPSIEQDAGRDTKLWIKNVLNRSSGDFSELKTRDFSKQLSVNLKAFGEGSLQSVSIGKLVPRPAPPPSPPLPPPPEPEYVICIPPQLDFVNFTVGQLHTQSVRLVNVTKFEVRLSIRPPSRRELTVELCSRLVLSAGASSTLLLHYRPTHVRVLTDELLVRVSAGKAIVIPICCYMEPPLLDILIPSVSSPQSSLFENCYNVADVLDLGTKLVGDVHRTPLIFNCENNLAAFFLLSEDAWINFTIDVPSSIQNVSALNNTVGVPSDCFWISPSHFAGGGTITSLAVCLATSHGVHTTAFKILSSTAIVRTINLVADALLFKPDHVTLQAHEKDYDICSPDDQGCEYYVNLGIAFPHRSLATTIHIVNHTPVTYEYYWKIRRWGVCSCWESSESLEIGEEEELCPGAPKSSPDDEENEFASYRNVRALHVEPGLGKLPPRSENLVEVRVPDVGDKLGVQRAVLMLVLRDIPKESFSPGLDPMIVKTRVIEENAIPGLCPAWSREVCDIVCTQMEVWWEVTPVCFVIDQPLLLLPRSRRVKSIKIPIEATLVSGITEIRASWKMPESSLSEIQLKPGQTVLTNIQLPLQNLPDEYPEMKTIQLVAEGNEWSATTRIHTSCSTRYPKLGPAVVWLGVVPPGARVQAQIMLKNNTYQQMYWWGSSWRWWHENPVGEACKDQAPCDKCYDRSCTCSLLQPSRGALDHGEKILLNYDVYAPDSNGCVATLIQVRRTAPDLAHIPPGVGSEGRASLIAYRVLAPELMLRVLPCLGDKHTYCEACRLDEGPEPSQQGTLVLRPSAAMTVGRCACYRIICTNLTPLPTTLRWNPPIEGEDILKVTFIPNDIDIGAYAVMEVKVVVKPLRVCRRRIFVHQALLEYSKKPIYLLIDAAVKGLEVTIEVPLGGAEHTDASVIMRRSQMEDRSVEPKKPTLTIQEYFEEDDDKREVQKENICHCRYKMVYIPPKKPLRPPKKSEDEYSIDIVTEPPPLTRICPCMSCTKPVIPEHEEPICLQFRDLPIKTVRSRTITIRNLSTVTAKWRTAVRRWPRHHVRTLEADQWASDIRDPGIAVDCFPSQGVLTSRGVVEIAVRVYADCWGLYFDQILILIDHLEPIVLDLWVEVVGRPLRFAIKPDHEDTPPILWLSSSDPERVLNVTNISRADLTVQSFVIQEHGQPQDALPFRLYLRFYDIPPRTCPCCEHLKSESLLISEEETPSSLSEAMDTAIELILLADYGLQCDDYYKVSPAETVVSRGTSMCLQVKLSPSTEIPRSALLLRTIPVQKSGENWYRPNAAPQQVLLRAASRSPCLELSCKMLRVTLCALDMPFDDVIRIRKPFQVHNVGNGQLTAALHTDSPWRVVTSHAVCAASCQGFQPRPDVTQLDLPPRSSVELCAEVCLHSREAWPSPGEMYPTKSITRTSLNFFDEDHVVLASMQLVLELEFPKINAKPATLDFGCVTDGDTRKSYVTITHTSRSATIEMVTKLEGSKDFRVWPQTLILEPGSKGIIYVQYSARWKPSPAVSKLQVSAASGASSWCCTTVTLLATPTRDHVYHQPVHDYTMTSTYCLMMFDPC